MASYRLYATYPNGETHELSARPSLDVDAVPIEFPFIVGNVASRAEAVRRAKERAESDQFFDAHKIKVRLVLG